MTEAEMAVIERESLDEMILSGHREGNLLRLVAEVRRLRQVLSRIAASEDHDVRIVNEEEAEVTDCAAMQMAIVALAEPPE